MKPTLTLLAALLLALLAGCADQSAPRVTDKLRAETPTKADCPVGVSVTRDGTLSLAGKLLRAFGVNYMSAFSRTLEDGNDTSYDAGFKVLAARHIRWARFAACGFWRKNMKLHQDDRAEYFRRMDGVVRSAEKHGVGLVPSLFWHMAMVPDLVGEPCSAWGDPASKTHAFLRQYTREVVTRYKDSPAIWGWEFGNEYNLEADLAFEWHQPMIAPPMGTPAARSKRDNLTTAMINTALAAFAGEVRKHDPHRFITSGHAIVRKNAYNLLHGKAWITDTPAQSREMLALQHPPGIDLLSAHLYTFPKHQLWDIERLEEVATDARALCRPLMIGEFQIPEAYVDQADTPAIREAFRSFLRRVDAAGVPLTAVWVFDFPWHDKERCNITHDNRRGWQLDEMGAMNLMWAKQAAAKPRPKAAKPAMPE
jgi:hypothetical protein